MVMFMGEYRHNLDSKNRLIVPSKFRDQLSTTVYVTEWMDGCLAAYAETEWNEMVDKLNRLPKTYAAVLTILFAMFLSFSTYFPCIIS